MNQLTGLWRDTRWHWIAFLVIVFGLAIFYHALFLVMIFQLLFIFCYFAYMRYDDDGNRKSDF